MAAVRKDSKPDSGSETAARTGIDGSQNSYESYNSQLQLKGVVAKQQNMTLHGVVGGQGGNCEGRLQTLKKDQGH